MYQCKECGKPAVVTDKGVVRSCDCDAIVVTTMAADLEGKGNLN